MAIYLNGNENPLSIKFNGTDLLEVWSKPQGGSTYYEVWNKSRAFPETINLIRLKSGKAEDSYKGGSCDVYLRDLVKTRQYYTLTTDINPDDNNPDLLAYHIEYEAQISADLSWKKNRFAFMIHPDGYVYFPDLFRCEAESGTCSGVPEELEEYGLSYNAALTHSLDFTLSDTSAGKNFFLEEDTRIVDTAQVGITSIQGGSSYFWVMSDYPFVQKSAYGLFAFAANSGLIFQGKATVDFSRTVDSIST